MIGILQKQLEKQLDRIREKNFQNWIGGYARHVLDNFRAPRPSGPRHLLFAICDHWEPEWDNAPRAVGDARVKAWVDGYPELARNYRDADGRNPRHSFFFPGEQYKPEWLDALADFTRNGFGEVELHLHHDNDTPEKLRADLDRYLEEMGRHGHFSRDESGRKRYGFIHGNWCLSNSRRDGRMCGVDAELPLLFETGVRARVGEVMNDRILMIEGPLCLALRPGKLAPRLEYSGLQYSDPPTPDRIRNWTAQNIHVEGRPEWVFVKVYAHGAPEFQAGPLLGEHGHMLHRELTTRYNDGREWVLHYVTAREMYNIAIAALEGKSGNPNGYRDYRLKPPPCAS
jgi:hypothetical protein